MKHICETKKDYIDAMNSSTRGDAIYCTAKLWKEIFDESNPKTYHRCDNCGTYPKLEAPKDFFTALMQKPKEISLLDLLKENWTDDVSAIHRDEMEMIEIRITDHPQAWNDGWIPLHRCPIFIEKLVKEWIENGGEI